jgi:poly(3-hydroxyalkanoate) depolymerase
MTKIAQLDCCFTRIKDVQIRYSVKKGSGAGVLLIFNGIGASMELLQPFTDVLGDTTVISYDAPGAGASSVPKYPWRPRHHAALAASLLERLGYDKIDVLGVSWGGMVAQQFARQYPDRCRRLILAATSPGHLMVPGKLSVMLRMASPLRYLLPDYMEAIAGKIYGGSLRTNKLRAKQHASRMKPPSTLGYYSQVLALVGWSSLPWLHTLRQPTLVLAGDDDPIIPLINAKVLAALIPNARLRVVDCGHLFILTRASILAPEIEDFLAHS